MSCAKVNLCETEKNGAGFQTQWEQGAKAAQETHTPARVTGTTGPGSALCQAVRTSMGTGILGEQFRGDLPK